MRKLIDLSQMLSGADRPSLLARSLAKPIEMALGFNRLNALHDRFQPLLEDAEDDPAFFSKLLLLMGIQFEVETDDYQHLPREGPLLVVANHPFGALDGIILGALLKGIRGDAKLLANYLLGRIDGIRGSLISVDPFGRASSGRANLAGLKMARRHLASGGCLGVFPSGKFRAMTGGRML